MLLKITQLMDQFERQFEHLDVQTQTMDEAMSGATTLTVPEVLHCINLYDAYNVHVYPLLYCVQCACMFV